MTELSLRSISDSKTMTPLTMKYKIIALEAIIRQLLKKGK